MQGIQETIFNEVLGSQSSGNEEGHDTETHGSDGITSNNKVSRDGDTGPKPTRSSSWTHYNRTAALESISPTTVEENERQNVSTTVAQGAPVVRQGPQMPLPLDGLRFMGEGDAADPREGAAQRSALNDARSIAREMLHHMGDLTPSMRHSENAVVRYFWKEGESKIDVWLPLPEGVDGATAKTKLDITFGSRSLYVALKDYPLAGAKDYVLLADELNGKIFIDEAYWVLVEPPAEALQIEVDALTRLVMQRQKSDPSNAKSDEPQGYAKMAVQQYAKKTKFLQMILTKRTVTNQWGYLFVKDQTKADEAHRARIVEAHKKVQAIRENPSAPLV